MHHQPTPDRSVPNSRNRITDLGGYPEITGSNDIIIMRSHETNDSIVNVYSYHSKDMYVYIYFYFYIGNIHKSVILLPVYLIKLLYIA